MDTDPPPSTTKPALHILFSCGQDDILNNIIYVLGVIPFCPRLQEPPSAIIASLHNKYTTILNASRDKDYFPRAITGWLTGY